ESDPCLRPLRPRQHARSAACTDHTHTHTHTHTQAQTHTHTHTHIYTYTETHTYCTRELSARFSPKGVLIFSVMLQGSVCELYVRVEAVSSVRGCVCVCVWVCVCVCGCV